jgi:hypothetical protein
MVEGVIKAKPTLSKSHRDKAFYGKKHRSSQKTLPRGTKTARFYPNPTHESNIGWPLTKLAAACIN